MKIWSKTKDWAEGKFLVVRRDGTVPRWPYFVLGARDPYSAPALRAYAKSYRNGSRENFDEEFYLSILQLAVDFEDYRIAHGDGDPDAPPHRHDDEQVLAAMRKECVSIVVGPDKADAEK